MHYLGGEGAWEGVLMEKADKKTDKLPAVTQGSNCILIQGNGNRVFNNLNKIDKRTEEIHQIQAELNRRTAEEQRAADLMTEGRNADGDAVLAALDDDVIKKLSEGQGE